MTAAPRLPAAPFVYPIVDPAAVGDRGAAEAVARLARAGARIVQLRAKGVPDRDLLALAREAVAAAHGAGALLIVNDRPDVALIAAADGVHVGQDDVATPDARRVLPGGVLGLSTHDAAQLEAAASAPVDYVAVGPVFPTAKPDAQPVVGLDFVRSARSRLRVPLVAIGGIGRGNARAVVAAGADGVAVISALLRAPDLEEALADLAAEVAAGARDREPPAPRA